MDLTTHHRPTRGPWGKVIAIIFLSIAASMFFAQQSNSFSRQHGDAASNNLSQESSHLQTLEESLARSSQNQYKEGEYICGHFSYDLMNILTEQDIKTRMMIGKKHGHDDIHAWISVDINPQTGKIESTTIDDAYELIDVCDINSQSGALDCIAGNTISMDHYMQHVTDRSNSTSR